MTKSTGWSAEGAKGSQHWLHYIFFPGEFYKRVTGWNKTRWGRKDGWGDLKLLLTTFTFFVFGSLSLCPGFDLFAAVPWDGRAWSATSLWRGPAGISCPEASEPNGWLQHTCPLPASGWAFSRSYAWNSGSHVTFCTARCASLSGSCSGLSYDAALPHRTPCRDSVEPHSYSGAQAKGRAGHASADPPEGGGSGCHDVHLGALERFGRLQPQGQYGRLPHNCTPVVRLWMHSLWSGLLHCEYCVLML